MAETINATLAYGDSDEWSNDANACQGLYNASEAKIESSRCGIMEFEGLSSVVSNKTINSITLKITLSTGAGFYSRRLKLQLYTCDSAHQTIDKSKSATSYATSGTKLTAIEIEPPADSPNQSLVFNSSTNSGMFSTLKSYFANKNQTLCIYNGESTAASNNCSSNYLRITACSIVVDVSDIQYTLTYDRNGFTTSEVTLPSGGTYKTGTEVTIGTPTVSKRVESVEYTVTLNLHGGDGSTTSRQSKKIETSVFQNWNTKTDGSGTAYAAGAKHKLTANLKLYIRCTTSVERVPVNLPEVTKTGYTFLGWGTTATQTSGLIPAGNYQPTKSLTLHAIWKANGSGHIFDGSGNKMYQIYVYDGNTWKLCVPKIYNGSTWDTIYT